MKKRELFIYGIVLAIIIGVGYLATKGNQDRLPSIAVTPYVSQRQGICHSVNNFPDPKCQTGSVNSSVIQTQIQDTTHSTICVRGYTAKIRPSVSYTESLKIQQIKDYGYADTNLRAYSEDHIVPLEAGGNPTDPQNLYPEPLADSYKKDRVENLVHNAICNGSMTLYQGQMIFLDHEWQNYYK